MRILKKIVPIAVMSLLACTSFAFAADLATWQDSLPGADTAIVLGESAATTDNLGAINIASTLSTGAVGVDAITGEAEKIEASNNLLALGESFSNIEPSGFDDSELPLMLAEGTYRAHDSDDFDYKQKIVFGTTYPQATFKKDSDSPVPDEPVLMIFGKRSTQILNYTLNFIADAKSTNTSSGTLDDFENSHITLLGERYDIINADVTTTKGITLDLMAGAVKDTLNEDEEATYTIDGVTYTVKLDMIATTGKAKFTVNGEASDALSEGALYKFSFDIQLGVSEILYQDYAGGKKQATFYLGAEKLTLQDTDWSTNDGADYVELDGENIIDLKLDIDGSWDGSDVKISKIIFQWEPEDDIFMTDDSPVIFPGLGSIKISYEGLTTLAEESTTIQPSGNDKFEITANLESGKKSFYILYTNGTHFEGVGGDTDEELLTAQDAVAHSGVVFDEDVNRYFVVTYRSGSYSGESYLVKARTYNYPTYNYTDFIDGITAETLCEKITPGETCDVGESVITVKSGVGGVLSATQVNFSVDSKSHMDYIDTKEGLMIYLPVELTDDTDTAFEDFRTIGTTGLNISSYTLDVWEEAPTAETVGNADFNITLEISSSKTTVSTVPDTEGEGVLGYNEVGDTNDYAAYSNFSTKWIHSKPTGGQYEVEIIYPGEEGEMIAYVAEETASIITGAATVGGKVTPVMDTEVDETIKAMNIISVGGSAINSITADLLGLDYPTYGTDDAWVEATGVSTIGEALIKIMDSKYTDGKYAMIVAGYEGLDTQRAAKALSEGTPALSGESVILSTVSEEVVVAS